jgi:hypothetical protein
MPYKFNVFTGTLDIVNPAGGGSGNVIGLPPTDINAIARWADTSADSIKNSPGTLIQDGGAIQAAGFIGNRSVTTLISIPSEYYMIAAELELELTGAIQLEADGELIIL